MKNTYLNSEIEDMFEELHHGVDISDIAITSETLAEFEESAGKHWSYECQTSGNLQSGLKWVQYSRVQIGRGQPRHDLIVIDLGEKRAAYKA